MLVTMNVIRTVLKRNHQIISYRCCHSHDHNVRVRFAPSPTGYLHLGGLRTALYNYLFAKANNGKFIVRIEDTDQTRVVPDAMESIFKDLDWAGITPDESVIHGGSHGPYIQSQRLDIYRKEVKTLLENGSAYYCFCTQRRLELLRIDALRANQTPKYDNRCRHLTPVQVAEKLANHDSVCIRFKLEPTIPKFNDLVYGEIEYDVAHVEGDPIIIKTDGYPTYHFANVVDDHLMEVSHVLRGQEWQISTTKHLLMYQAFGWTPPQYGHLPLLLNQDGSKLSKRHSNAGVEYYRNKGIFPQALLNYITLNGGGFQPKDRGEKMKSYSLSDLVEQFDINKVNKTSTRLSSDLLDECNRLAIIDHVNNPVKCKELVAHVQELIKATYPNDVKNLDIDDAHIRNVLNWASYRLTSLHQLVEGDLAFLWILPKIKDDNLHSDVLDKLVTVLEKGDFDKTHLSEILKEFSAKNNLKFPTFMKSLRKLLSGLKDGPGVAEMMEILGRKGTLYRLRMKKKHETATKEDQSK